MNRDLLAQSIGDALRRFHPSGEDDYREAQFDLADLILANQPVLVISEAVLTDEICARIAYGDPDMACDLEAEPAQLRAALSRLAKGDTP